MNEQDKKTGIDVDGLVEAARILGSTQANKRFGCYTEADSRTERAMYESIQTRVKAIERLSAENEQLKRKHQDYQDAMQAASVAMDIQTKELAALKIELSETKDALFLSDALVKELQALKAQGEPVAYFQVTGEHQGYKHYEQVARKHRDDSGVFPLYLRPPVSIPEGWQLVPKEPTEEMANAFDDAAIVTRNDESDNYVCNTEAAIKSAIAAAPHPPVVSEDAKDAELWKKRFYARVSSDNDKSWGAFRDSARLNWLEENPRHAQILIDGTLTDCVFYGISCAELVKLREAIDKAMEGK